MYISRQSRSPLSNDKMSSSAVARLVASGILCSSQIRKILFTSGSCGLGFNGSRRKMTRSMSLCSICAPSCWMPPKCPARYLCTERFATSSIRRPVVPVAYKLFLLKIPLYAMQKFCITAGKWGEIYTKFTPTRPFLSLTCILAHFSGDEKGGAAKFCASFIGVWYNNKRKNGSGVGGAL